MTQITQIDPFSSFDNDKNVDYKAFMDNVTPQGNHIIVLPACFQNKRKSGIILVDSAQEARNDLITVGKVVKLGPIAYRHSNNFYDPETKEHLPWAKEGDWISFSKLGNGIKCEYAGVKYWVLTDTQVLNTIGDPSLVYPNLEFSGFEIDSNETDK